MTDAEAIAEAVAGAAYWGGCPAPRLIKNRENAVFEVYLPQGRAALRLHRTGYQSPAAIRSELWWATELARAGLPVPAPLPALSGETISSLPSGRHVSVIRWADGAGLGEAGVLLCGSPAEQAALHHALGKLVARIHAATDSLVLPDAFERPNWDADGLLGETPFWGRFWDHPALTPAERELLTTVRTFARARLATLGAPDLGLIHADVLRENVLVHDGAPTLIDFDDCGFGYRLYDLGTALSQNLSEPGRADIAAALVEGYAVHRPLPADALHLVDLFTLLRCCASVGWTIPRLAPNDPRHRLYIDRALAAARPVLDGAPLFS